MSGSQYFLTTEHSDDTSTADLEDGGINKAIGACQAVQIAVLLFSIWILLCAIIYGYKTKKWRKRPGSNSLDQGIMYSCCVAAIALTLPKIIFTNILLFVYPDILSPVCEAMMDASHGLYFVAKYPTYFYLWLRQRAIYSHPTAQKLAGKCVILSGWAVLLILTGLSIALVWAFIAPDTYKSSSMGCVIDSENDDHANLFYALAGLLILAQISFLSLFIYPMVRCEVDQMRKRSRSVSISQSVVLDEELSRCTKIQSTCRVCRKILCGARDSEQGSSLARTIRRSVYAAFVAMTSDLTVMLIAAFVIPTSIPRMIPDTLYDVSILINSLCILATFGNNRKILCVLWSYQTDKSLERRNRESTQINFVQSVDEIHENDVSRFEHA